jgi:hypothetical protein
MVATAAAPQSAALFLSDHAKQRMRQVLFNSQHLQSSTSPTNSFPAPAWYKLKRRRPRRFKWQSNPLLEAKYEFSNQGTM